MKVWMDFVWILVELIAIFQLLYHARADCELSFTLHAIGSGFRQGSTWNVLKNSNVTLTCYTEHGTFCNSSVLSIVVPPRRGFETPSFALVSGREVAAHNQELTGPEVIELYLQNVNERDNGLYRCCQESCGTTLADLQTFPQKSIILNIGGPPEEPGDMQCISNNWEDLNCKWLIKSSSKNTVCYQVSYILNFGIKVNELPKGCTVDNKSWLIRCLCTSSCFNVDVDVSINSSITCSLNDEPSFFYKFQTYVFMIEGSTKFASAMWPMSVYTDMSIVRLSPPTTVSAEPLADKHLMKLNVSWTNQIDLNFTGISYMYTIYHKQSSWNSWKINTISTKRAWKKEHFLLTDLLAYCNYTVKVKRKLHGSRIWSNSMDTTVATLQDIPTSPPEVFRSGFTRCSYENCIRIYWKSIPKKNQNGVIDGFEIKVDDKSAILNENGYQLTMVLSNISDDLNHTISIRSRTEIGFSRESSMFMVPTISDVLPSVWVTVESISRLKYLVSWDLKSRAVEDVYSTICWCLGVEINATGVQCMSSLDWINVSRVESSYKVVLNDSEVSSDILQNSKWYFGVSLLYKGLSNGISWNKCVFDFFGGTSKPEIVITRWRQTDVNITWKFTYCDTSVMKGRPMLYQLVYYHMDVTHISTCSISTGQFINQTSNYNTKQFTLTLPTNGKYGFCLRILTRSGFGPFSDLVEFQLDNAGKLSMLIGLSTSLSLVMCIVLLVVCRRRKKFVGTFKIPIALPPLYDDNRLNNNTIDDVIYCTYSNKHEGHPIQLDSSDGNENETVVSNHPYVIIDSNTADVGSTKQENSDSYFKINSFGQVLNLSMVSVMDTTLRTTKSYIVDKGNGHSEETKDADDADHAKVITNRTVLSCNSGEYIDHRVLTTLITHTDSNKKDTSIKDYVKAIFAHTTVPDIVDAKGTNNCFSSVIVTNESALEGTDKTLHFDDYIKSSMLSALTTVCGDSKDSDMSCVINNDNSMDADMSSDIKNANSMDADMRFDIKNANYEDADMSSDIKNGNSKDADMSCVINNTNSKVADMSCVINNTNSKDADMSCVINNTNSKDADMSCVIKNVNSKDADMRFDIKNANSKVADMSSDINKVTGASHYGTDLETTISINDSRTQIYAVAPDNGWY